MASNSDLLVPTQKAVKTYADSVLPTWIGKSVMLTGGSGGNPIVFSAIDHNTLGWTITSLTSVTVPSGVSRVVVSVETVAGYGTDTYTLLKNGSSVASIMNIDRSYSYLGGSFTTVPISVSNGDTLSIGSSSIVSGAKFAIRVVG